MQEAKRLLSLHRRTRPGRGASTPLGAGAVLAAIGASLGLGKGPRQRGGLCFTTVNANAPNGLLRALRSGTLGEAPIVAGQELVVGPDAVAQFSSVCGAEGWATACSPSVRTIKGGWSAGVALLARQCVGGLRSFEIDGDKGRACAVEARPKLFGPISVASFYGVVGEPSEKRGLSAEVRAQLEARGAPWLIFCDFHFSPALVRGWGDRGSWATAVTVTPSGHAACVVGSVATIDFAIAHPLLRPPLRA